MPGGYLSVDAYDVSGNLLSQTRYAGAVSYTSQTLAQLVSARLRPRQNQVSTRQYDALNRLSSQIDAQGTSTTYSYDTRGFLIRRKRRRRRRHRHQPERRPGACRQTHHQLLLRRPGALTGHLLGIGSTAYAAATPPTSPPSSAPTAPPAPTTPPDA